MPRPAVAPQIAAQIVEHIKTQRLPVGTHLPAQGLADQLRVSRAPVTAALKKLEALKIVRSEPNRGFFVMKGGDGTHLEHVSVAEDVSEVEDDIYFRMAEDRLASRVPDRVSESELMRIYGVSRIRLHKILHRVAEEGWVERLPGNGWEFKATLSSRESYADGYQFRASIEAEALLLPTFRINTAAFADARREQETILGGGYKRMSRDHLFASNAGFHEMLMSCSGNTFFIDSLRRVNRLRRLIEYRITVDRSRLPRQCKEHLRILDLIEAGKMEDASAYLRRHILGASAVKSPQIARSQ